MVLLTACTTSITDEPILIGGAFGLTGWASAWGEEDLRGAILAMEDINARGGIGGRKIKLVIQDTQSDNDATLTAVHALVSISDVDAVLGPTWFETYQSAATISDQGIVMMTPSGVIEGIQLESYHPYVYSTWYSFKEELAVMMEHLANQGDTRIVLIMGLTPYWKTISTIVERDAESYGLTVLEKYEIETIDDYRTILLQSKKLQPDAILFGMDDEQSMFDMLKQRRELGIETLFVGQEYLIPFATESGFTQYFEGVHIVAPSDMPEEFARKYEERFGAAPQLSASTSYDAMSILAEAIGSTDGTLEQVVAYLNTHSFDTVTHGTTEFRRNGGVSGGEFVVYEVREGTVQQVAD